MTACRPGRVIVLLLVLLVATPGWSGPQSKSLLILNWYGIDAVFRKTLDENLEKALTDVDPTVELYSETLEDYRFGGEPHVALMRSYLRNKYAGVRLDAVIAVTDPAVIFMANYGKEIFPGVPVAYLKTLPYNGQENTVGMTGVTGLGAVGLGLELVQRLHPALGEIIVIDGTSPNLGYLERETRKHVRHLSRSVKLEYLRDRPFDEVAAVLRNAPPNSVAFYFRQTLRTSTETMSLLTGLSEVVQASRVPVYSMVDAHVGHGVVGGMVSDVPRNTQELARIALRLANGTPVDQVRPVLATSVPMFDWRQLEKWGIPESRLPAGSLVLFRPQTIWSDYGYHVATAIGVVSAQFITIGLLLFLKQRRARAEAALRASEARNTAILRTMPDLMFILSSDGVYLDYHARDSVELFAPPEQFLGKRIRDIFPPDFAEMFEQQLEEAVRTGQTVVFEYTLPMPGARRQYECRMLGYGTDKVMVIVRDVTSRHESETQLHQAQTELANATRVRVLAEMAAGIAHEVNQPITAIVMNAQTGLKEIERQQPDEEILQDALQDIVSDGKRAAEVIGRVREMVTQTPPRMSAVDINDVVRGVIALCARTLQARDVRLQLDLARLPPTVGDPVQLQQVLLNLIVNAMDAMQENPPSARRLSIRSVRSSGGVTVRVSDSGAGLTEEVLQRLFMPFFSTKINGMGIGLSISRSIAELHGGHLRIVQNSSQGATFEFELPVPAD